MTSTFVAKPETISASICIVVDHNFKKETIMKNKKYLFISYLTLLAIFLSACAGNVYAAPGQSAGSQTGPIVTPAENTNNQENQPPANQGNQPRAGGPDLTAAAEALGVSVEDLQQALQDALPAECLNRNNGQGGPDPNCRPDLEAVASALGVTVEELQSALTSFAQGKGPGESNLVAAAETLGITVEELQQALESSLPEGCSTSNDGQAGPNSDCHPDFEAAAATLGITVEELQSALGGSQGNGQGGQGLNLTTAAETLGVTVDALQQALESALPSDCSTSNDGQSGPRPDCRPDLETAAATLGITVEELQSALGGPKDNGQGGPGLNLTTAADTLGVTEDQLKEALQNAVPSECSTSREGQAGDCRPDLDAVASALGVTVEELQSALLPQRQGDGLQVQNQNENRQSFQNGQGSGSDNGQPQNGGQPPQGGPSGGQPPRGGAGRP
jgi:transcriptional regulator with XRE-family HTH domain